MVRISVSSDGRHIKVKARGERRTVWKIPFRDEYRRRSFRTIKSVLEDLGFKELKEEPLERGVRIWYEVNGELCSRTVSTRDTALSARLPPPLALQEDLLKGERRVTFVYWGRGRFRAFLPEDADNDEIGALNRVLEDLVQPLYLTAFAGRLSEPQTRSMVEFCAEKVSGKVEGGVEENEIQTAASGGQKTPTIEETMPEEARSPEPPPAPPRCPTPPPAEATAQPESKLEEKTISIEEVRREIAAYQPVTFRERAAYERYRQALTSPWARGREDEIHRLFHSLIKGERRRENFEHYYKQLYRLAPGWLEARIRSPRKLRAKRRLNG